MARAVSGAFEKQHADNELAELLKNPPKALCVIGMMIAEHPNGPEIAGAVKNARWTAPQLATVLTQKIQPVSADAISRHRNGKCMCER